METFAFESILFKCFLVTREEFSAVKNVNEKKWWVYRKLFSGKKPPHSQL